MKKRCQMYSFSLKIQYQLRHLVESFKLKVYLFLDRLLKDVSKISENLKPSLWGRGRGFWLIDLHPEPPRDVLPQAIVVGAEAQVFNRIEGGADRDTAMEGGSADKIGWISVYNARFPIKQRYHYNVADERLHQHVEKDNEDGLYISCVASAANLWALIMDAGTGFSSQVYELSAAVFLPKDWIMEQWEKNYYITSIAGATNGRSLVVMSKGTPYTQQSYKVNESFPLKWINKKWKEGFHVTSITTAGNRWGVVMSRNSGFSEQVVELDFLYPGEGIHRLLESGYQITSMAATADQSAFILSVPKLKMMDETQETLRTSAFPSTHAKDMWSKNCYVRSLCYGRTVC